jgi:aspartate racemase
MKTIGMIGGMSWESSNVYYQQINREVQKRLGGVHSAKFLIYSFDFDEMATLQAAARWDEANALMVKVASELAGAGADFLLIACNTMHCATPQMEKAVALPLLHIADPLGAAIKSADLKLWHRRDRAARRRCARGEPGDL